jgi:small-conductance mechanosensitive channel
MSVENATTSVPSDLSNFIGQIFRTDQLTSDIFAAVILFAIIATVGWTAYFIIGRYFSKWALKTKTTLDDEILRSIKTIVVLLVIVVGMYYALSSLTVLQAYNELIADIFTIVEILLIAFAITRITNVLAEWYIKRNRSGENGRNNHVLFLLKKIVQLFVYVMAFLVILYVRHVDLSGVVVGLGVGGIALAFAVQNSLGDVLGAFTIYFDRPFEIGDFIIVGQHSGTVTNIGIKSTRIKLLQGEELVISNKELTSTCVRNFRKLERRRVTFTIGVDYSTPTAKLKKIPEMIKKIVENVEFADLDRVNFTEFGDFSLKFLVIYYVNVAEYGKYLEIQEAINFAIKEAFEKEGIEIAFPTQTIYVKK